VEILKTWFRDHYAESSNDHRGIECPLCLIAEDMQAICDSPGRLSYTPAIVKSRGSWSHGDFANFQQHDATQAITTLFDALDEGHLQFVPARIRTPMWDVMGIESTQRLICYECGCQSPKSRKDNSLALEVPPGMSRAEELLQKYWGEQELKDGDDPYRCPAEAPCADGSVVKNFLDATRWPPVLFLSFKRWKYSAQTGTLQKLGEGFEVTFETVLQVHECNHFYQLRGVIEHHGSAGGGHYTSYVRSYDNYWYFCDDDQNPKRASIQDVLGAQAYVLVYEANHFHALLQD
jgi:uncharacterized UBP type Zn finger protein